MKDHIYVSFDTLPDGRNWKIGKNYHTKMVLKLVGIDEEQARFEIVEATSLEAKDIKAKYWLSGDGSYRGS